MQKGTLSKKAEVVIHMVYWLLMGYFTFFKNPMQVQLFIPDLFISTYLMVFVLTFYFHYLLIMKRVFKSFQWKRFLGGVLVSYLFFTAMRWLLEQVITKILFDKVNYINPTFLNYMMDNLHYSSMAIILSSLLWFVIYFIRLLEYNQLILEENKNTEIKFLKAQINPHFIFNTLNNIYSMVYFQSEKSLTAIEKLSQIMRFTTYESQKENIKLADEIEYIKAYIDLEQLRHEGNAFVDFRMEMENAAKQIPPYILSPLIENALKHGIACSEKPIVSVLKLKDEKLTFKVINDIAIQKKDKLRGIGLNNLKARLEIYYPNKHQLQVRNQNNQFIAELEIDLG